IIAPSAYLWQHLYLTASRVTHDSAFLEWSSDEDRPEQREASLKFSGYLLTGRSRDHTFQKIIGPTVTKYNVSCLKPWNEYNITLRRFYSIDGNNQPPVKLGRAAAEAVRTSAYTPPSPRAIDIIAAAQSEVTLRITDPLAWNGLPLKYHVRWEPKDPGRGHPGNVKLDIPSTRLPDQYWMNVNLSLEPGVTYMVFVSAETTGKNPNITFQGPEVSRDVATIPLDPSGLNVDSLSSRELLVSWTVSGPAEFFRVKVVYYLENPDFGTPSQPRHVPDRYGRRRYVTTTPAPRFLQGFRDPIVVDGGGSASSVRSVIVDELPPSTNYNVEVEACSSGGCSGTVKTSVIAKPIAIPEPVITDVASNSSSSFHVAWTFPHDDSSYYDGFRVRYCSAASFCRDNYTHLHNLNAINLSAGTSFDVEVRARVKHADGRVELGPSAKAQVSTWKDVPLEPGLEVRGSVATSNKLVLSWTFVNSTVDYLQVSKEDDVWVNCTDNNGCDAAVMHGWRPQFKTGFITLRNLEPYTLYNVSLRGCNDGGCGEQTAVHVKTGMAAPSEPAELSLSRNGSTVVVAWEHPVVPAGPLSGYFVSWQCPSKEERSTTVGDLQLFLQDLQQEGSNCTFRVSGFNKTPEGHLLIGTAAVASLS
ncbi:unnamed protein product, partial [Ixodes hexagonus]